MPDVFELTKADSINSIGTIPAVVEDSEEKKPDIGEYFRDICHTCGVVNAITSEFLFSKIRNQREYYCPNGHRGTITWNSVREVERAIRIPLENFVKLTCGGCGVHWKMTKEFYDLKNENYEGWYCPNGCKRHFKKPPPPPPPPKTAADIDYEKLISYHNALGEIARLEPKTFECKKLLKQAVLIAKNTLRLQEVKHE